MMHLYTVLLSLMIIGTCALSSVLFSIGLFAAFMLIGSAVLGAAILNGRMPSLTLALEIHHEVIFPVLASVIIGMALRLVVIMLIKGWLSRNG